MKNELLTFANIPSYADLGALDTDVCMVGIPYGTPYDPDIESGSQRAPQVIRQESVRYPDDPIALDFDLDGTWLGGSGVQIVDYGDLSGDQKRAEENRLTTFRFIRDVLAADAVPVVLGGDDSIPIPVLRAYEAYGPFRVIQQLIDRARSTHCRLRVQQRSGLRGVDT